VSHLTHTWGFHRVINQLRLIIFGPGGQSEHPEAELLSQLDLANQLLMNPMSRGTLKNGLDLKLEHILQKSGYQPSNQGLGNAKNIRYALQPSGYDQLTGWASQGKSISDFWWISGAPQSGRSTLCCRGP